MRWLPVAEVIAGVAILFAVLQDAFRVVVMPRPYYGFGIGKALLIVAWRAWRPLGVRRRTVERREGALGAFAPLALLVLLGFWVLGLVLGYGLILHALRDELTPRPPDFGSALYVAGTSLLTLGFGDIVPTGFAARVVVLLTAASGPALVGLVLALLFSLYASYQRREALITTLDARAGAPPSGVRLLQTYAALGMAVDLPETFRTWELWTAEVLDSHLAYPPLAFFRSSHDSESWISALGAVLDAATLTLSALDGMPAGAAELMFDIGVHAVEDLTHYFRLEHVHAVGVERAEFEEAMVTLATAGYRLRPVDEAWASFAELRGRYAGPLNALAHEWATPPALWIGDRSTLHGGNAHDGTPGRASTSG